MLTISLYRLAYGITDKLSVAHCALRVAPFTTSPVFAFSDIIQRISKHEQPPFRPTISHGIRVQEPKANKNHPKWVDDVMTDSWTDDPHVRPSVHAIKTTFLKYDSGRYVYV